jgi:hypothetical protein
MLKLYKSGAYVVCERNAVSGFYTVTLRNPAGNVHDKVSCDTYRSAREYARAFGAIARGFK